MVRPVKTEYQAIQARGGARASKAKTAPPAPQASSDHRANLARRARLETEVIPGHRGRRASTAYRGLPGRRAPR
ncbi:hypothetical protein EYF80_062856 [Liparis tanakae]|uniref:Uncharacterized protein n=1 Tax=Liparis tanakae TaxID=230148 RepID=A0A4Z2EE28_9TELE|nr:hypothetical protein EYF80_062856 [Liparis tanakae]